jgi:protein-S-isoprenylcysteine O-methyltransferase Ste14
MNIDIRKIAIGCGRQLFKVRSYTPILLILVMLFCVRGEWVNCVVTWLLGLLFLLCGESLRLCSLRYIGKFSRTRKRKSRMLVTGGPYALVRNPLYWGNLLIILGYALVSGLLWFIPVIVVLFFIQYQCIVLWEEESLREFYPADAEDYFRNVPRWFPNRRGLRNYLQHDQHPNFGWQDVFKREKSTLQGLVVVCIAMMAKEFFS